MIHQPRHGREGEEGKEELRCREKREEEETEGELRRIKERWFTRRMDKEGRIVRLQNERKKERKGS